MKRFLFITLIPIEIILLFLLQYFINDFFNSTIVQTYIIPNFKNLDSNITSNIFNGLIDALIAFIMIALLAAIIKKPLKEFGFNLKNVKFSLRATSIFLLTFMPLYVLFGSLAAWNKMFNYNFAFPLNISNYSVYLFFELFISGFEEIYYRCFLIMLLIVLWKPIFKSQRSLEISVIIASTLIFVLRHIGFDLKSVTITYLVPLQLLVTTIMGLSFSYIFIKSKCLLGAYLSHGASNFLITIFLLVLNLVLR